MVLHVGYIHFHALNHKISLRNMDNLVSQRHYVANYPDGIMLIILDEQGLASVLKNLVRNNLQRVSEDHDIRDIFREFVGPCMKVQSKREIIAS